MMAKIHVIAGLYPSALLQMFQRKGSTQMPESVKIEGGQMI